MRTVLGFLKSEVHRKRNLLEGYYVSKNPCVEFLIPDLEKEIEEFDQAIMMLENKLYPNVLGTTQDEEADFKSLVEQLPPPKNKYGEWIQALEYEPITPLLYKTEDIGLNVTCNLGSLELPNIPRKDSEVSC